MKKLRLFGIILILVSCWASILGFFFLNDMGAAAIKEGGFLYYLLTDYIKVFDMFSYRNLLAICLTIFFIGLGILLITSQLNKNKN